MKKIFKDKWLFYIFYFFLNLKDKNTASPPNKHNPPTHRIIIRNS
ncbi:hypothetical protein Cabys_2425 [Caldithrix abyssi DSM 13497]|uniref:Uncharacterized protein n=1 Tax=Caldithrix abyssi DSM 13497 TaxID=880073 RepID=A0A1J1C9F3_CALAY|nr:hypothetical protein Cabys_2425 [Caldithrix abyssi DSM 13497]